MKQARQLALVWMTLGAAGSSAPRAPDASPDGDGTTARIGPRIVMTTGSPTSVDPSATTWIGCCL